MIGPLAQRGDRVCESLAPLSIVLGWNLPDPGQHQVRPQLVGEGKRQVGAADPIIELVGRVKAPPGGKTQRHQGKLHRPQQVPELAAARLTEARGDRSPMASSTTPRAPIRAAS